MTKKGFTLVELLSVILLLAILMVIVVPSAMKLRERGTEEMWETKKTLLIKATQSWFINNAGTFNRNTSIKNKVYCLKIDNLIPYYIDGDDSSNTIKNPITKSSINNHYIKIKVTNEKKENNVYKAVACTYEYVSSCTSTLN